MSKADMLLEIAENEQFVHEAGKRAERNAFWEINQDGGNRLHYANAYSFLGYTDENFNPIYPIKPRQKNGISNIFNYNTNITNTKVDIIVTDGSARQAFANCSSLQRIPYIKFIRCTDFYNTFQNCSKLSYIRVDGEIDQSIDFSACPLTVESAVSIITHLKNLASNKDSAAIAFSKHTADLLDENNTMIIPPKEPTYVYHWRDYIANYIYWGYSE